MDSVQWQIVADLGAAWIAGALIGAERSFHGRPAGFRTHALVCLAAAAAMLAARGPVGLSTPASLEGAVDSTRLAQGVMTGVGFLGAGVIFKVGVNVQGLTTAASVWATAAVGVLFGVGAMFPAVLTAAAILATLVVLRWVEKLLPSEVSAWGVFRFHADRSPDKAGLHAMLQSFGLTLRETSYARIREGEVFEFSGHLVGRHGSAFDELAAHLADLPQLLEFELDRIGK